MRFRSKIVSLLVPVCLLLAGTAVCIGTGVRYFYDAYNRLESVEYGDGTTIFYTYDANGNRLSRAIDPGPKAPSNPTYPNGRTSESVTGNISFTGGDPDAESPLTYDFYIGPDSSHMTKVASSSAPSFSLANLNLSCATPYWWKIVSTDQYGLQTTGPVWQFTTDPALPTIMNQRTPNVVYTTLSDAYQGALNGDTIKSQNIQLNENFTAGNNISVIIKGGYNCDLSANPGMTTIKGAVNITNGTVTLGNYIISN